MKKREGSEWVKGCSVLFFSFFFPISMSSFAFTPFGDIACKELDVWV